MKKLEIAMSIMLCFGFLLIFGAVGNADFTGVIGTDFWIIATTGLLMMAIPAAVGKVIVERRINNRSRKGIREQNQKFSRRK